MKRITLQAQKLPDQPRRTLLHGLAAGGVALGMAPWTSLFAATKASGNSQVLSGAEFELTIAKTPVNFTGKTRMATTINGAIPGPILRWREGDA
ncbi:MAG: multicopper oxidase domain-containing protein, partial [Gallionella sp.]